MNRIYTTCSGYTIDLLEIEGIYKSPILDFEYKIFLKGGKVIEVKKKAGSNITSCLATIISKWNEALKSQGEKKAGLLPKIGSEEIPSGIFTPAMEAEALENYLKSPDTTFQGFMPLRKDSILHDKRMQDIIEQTKKTFGEVNRVVKKLFQDNSTFVDEIETALKNMPPNRKRLLRIRYNTDAKPGDKLIWRVVREDWTEVLAQDVEIKVPTFTTMDKLPDGREKAHISMHYTHLQWDDKKLIVS